MFNAIQPKTPDAVLAGLQQHGASVGAKKLMQWEFKHARDALLSGIYVTLYNEERQYECGRIGKMSRCFCNHLFSKHKLKILKNGRFGKNPCQEEGCKCENFRFMWRRPEEIGQNFLVRRKGFDVTQWRPLCRCKHPHAVHDPVRTKCKECACGKFVSNFACLGCDGKWEEHVTLYEDRQLREELGKPVGKDFYPLSGENHIVLFPVETSMSLDVPEIQEIFLKQLEEEAAKNAEIAAGVTDSSSSELAQLETEMGQVALSEGTRTVASLEERQRNTLPARDKPERSVRLMKERGMLRKY